MPCYFDIETDGLHDNARITCAATWNRNGVIAWHSQYAKYMNDEDLRSLVDFLCQQDVVITFNGAHFDFRVLYFCTLDPRVIALAKQHVDICLCFAADKGYFTSLDSFMKGCKIPGKNGSGGSAIDLWLQGTRSEKEGILEYCKNDVRCLKDLFLFMSRSRTKVYRETKQGKRQKWFPKLANVENTLKSYAKKPPDTSWMTMPPRIDEVLDWSFQVPKLARDRYRDKINDHSLDRCARAATSIDEFDAMIADEVYAVAARRYSSNAF